MYNRTIGESNPICEGTMAENPDDKDYDLINDPRIELASTLAREGKRREADELAREILEDNPWNGAAWVILAGLTLDHELRLEYLNKAIESVKKFNTKKNRVAAKNAMKILKRYNEDIPTEE